MKNDTKADDGDMSAAVRCAEHCRSAKANAYTGGKPPKGPKPTGWKLNGVPVIGEKGMK